MPRVLLKLFATLRDEYGIRELEVECDGTLVDLARRASEAIGKPLWREIVREDGGVRDDRIILVNGVHVQFAGTRLRDGDVVAVFPPVAGG